MAEGSLLGEASQVSSSIPDELLDFIRRDSYSLLIKGSAGTGKTTLALTILRELDLRGRFLYISTRVSPTQLFTMDGATSGQNLGQHLVSPPTLDWLQVLALALVVINVWFAYSSLTSRRKANAPINQR